MLQQSTVENLLFPSEIIFLSSSLIIAVALKNYISLGDRMLEYLLAKNGGRLIAKGCVKVKWVLK